MLDHFMGAELHRSREKRSKKKPMTQNKHIYRVDKFKVPEAAQAEFQARAIEAQEFLRRQPGLIEARLLKKTGGPGAFNFVSMAVWESASAVAAARDVMAAYQKSKGFNPDEFRARMNIEADVAAYEEVVA